jgi:hypothetical protein
MPTTFLWSLLSTNIMFPRNEPTVHASILRKKGCQKSRDLIRKSPDFQSPARFPQIVGAERLENNRMLGIFAAMPTGTNFPSRPYCGHFVFRDGSRPTVCQ